MIDRFVELPGSFRPIKSDAKRVRDADAHAQMEVTVILRGPALPDPDHLPQPRLTREQFAQQYASSQADADAVAKVLARFGLKVEGVALATHSMRVSGSVGAMESAFHAGLGIYDSASQGQYRGREGTIKIPLELQGIVIGVLGLDQRQVAQRATKRSTTRVATPPKIAQVETQALSPLAPADLEARYQFPAGTAAGQTIAIAEFGGGYFPDDLQAFCTKYGLPVATVTTQSVNLPALTLQQIEQLPPDQQQTALDISIEVMMDVQIIASLCPQAQIIVYFATFDQKGWIDLLNQIVSDNAALPVSLSVSYGLAEDASDWSDQARTAINNSLNAVAVLGITTCVASGDDGSGAQMKDRQAHVNFPSSSPFVLSVGGTMLTGTTAQTVESTWWEAPGRRTLKGGGATGGGVSRFFPRPQWQNIPQVTVNSLNAGSIVGRIIPDVAALAGPPLYDLIFLGNDQPNGGTSASTPLWAALIARINAGLPAAQQQRFLTPLLYENDANTGQPRGATTCNDITSGQNASHPWPGVGYDAGPGYDAVSGWGTPIGTALQQSLS